MKPFNVTLTHAQANLIFNALQTHLNHTQNEATSLIQYLDNEFKKANAPVPAETEQPKAEVEQPAG